MFDQVNKMADDTHAFIYAVRRMMVAQTAAVTIVMLFVLVVIWLMFKVLKMFGGVLQDWRKLIDANDANMKRTQELIGKVQELIDRETR
jgi:hypothetical protein